MADKVRTLGAADYAEREDASRALVTLGRVVLPYLRPAVNDPDLEISRRARRCIERIHRSPNPSLLALAALLVKDRRPPGAAAVLLDYLPNVEDETLEETWLDALRAVVWRDGRIEPALRAALRQSHRRTRSRRQDTLATRNERQPHRVPTSSQRQYLDRHLQGTLRSDARTQGNLSPYGSPRLPRCPAIGGRDRVVEIDGSGKIRWEYSVRKPMSVTRLRNGHTLIASFEDRCILEVDRAGKGVDKQPLQGRPFVVRRR